MRQGVPDAPYIIKAQQEGIYSPDPVLCPICKCRCQLIYKSTDGEVFACENCVKKEDAYEWAEEE